MVHTHNIFNTKQRSAWAQWCCVCTKPIFVSTQLCFVRTVYARREAEICARTFWLHEDEAELCAIEHFRKDTALLRPTHMTAAFSSLRVDITNTFLNGDIEENVYIEIPEFLEKMLPEMIIKIKLLKGRLNLKGAASNMLKEMQNGSKVCLMTDCASVVQTFGCRITCTRIKATICRCVRLSSEMRD